MLQQDGLKIPLLHLMEKIDGKNNFHDCVIRATTCNELNACPLHYQMEGVRKKMEKILSDTTVKDLLHSDRKDFLRSIALVREAI